MQFFTEFRQSFPVCDRYCGSDKKRMVTGALNSLSRCSERGSRDYDVSRPLQRLNASI